MVNVQTEPSSETRKNADDVSASSTAVSDDVVEKLATDLTDKCGSGSTDEATSGGEVDQAVATVQDTGVTSVDQKVTATEQEETDVRVSEVDKMATNSDERRENQQQPEVEQASKDKTEMEDREISFKKQEKQEVEQVDVESIKDAHDVNLNKELEMTANDKSTCCSA